jgi:hypothetical protein
MRFEADNYAALTRIEEDFRRVILAEKADGATGWPVARWTSIPLVSDGRFEPVVVMCNGRPPSKGGRLSSIYRASDLRHTSVRVFESDDIVLT